MKNQEINQESKPISQISDESYQSLKESTDYSSFDEPIVKVPEGDFQLQHDYIDGNYCGSNWVKVG